MIEIIIASILVSTLFSLLGCFVLWKKYAYFADGIAHSSMLSIVISHLLNIAVIPVSLLNSVIFSCGFLKFSGNSNGRDATLAIAAISSIMVATSIIIVDQLNLPIRTNSLLFGDILSIQFCDIILLACLCVIILLFLYYARRHLLLSIISPEIASISCNYSSYYNKAFILLLAFAIIFSVKIVGTFLVTSSIIFPAMIAGNFAKSPASMLKYSFIAGQIMNVFALASSFYFDLSFAPTIVIIGFALKVMTSYITRAVKTASLA